MCQFCRPLENLLQRDRHPALLRPLLPLLSKVHGKAKPLLGRCYRKPLAAAIKFHRTWEASGLFPDKLRRFEEEIENLQREVENHEEILVDLQGYGRGIGRWGSVGGGKSKASSKTGKMEDRPPRDNGRTRDGRRRERDPYVEDGEEKPADSDDSRSSSRRGEDGEEVEEEDEEDEEEEEDDEGAGQVSGRNTPAPDAANVPSPRLSNPRHRDASAAPTRSAIRRSQLAGLSKQEPEASTLPTPLLPGPQSPKTTKKEKPRFRFRKGVKAYINDIFEYKVSELVDSKVEKRLALERSREPGRAPASGVSDRNVTFSQGVKEGDFSIPDPKRAAAKKANSKLLVQQPGQLERPRSSTGPRSSPYLARSRIPAAALSRVRSSRPGTAITPTRSLVPPVVVGKPEPGNLDAEERGGQEEEWVDIEEGESIDEGAEDAEEVAEAISDAASMVADDGVSDADDGVYQDIQSMTRLREIHPEPDAAAFVAHATIEDDVTSDNSSVDPVRLVRDLWPNLGPRRPLKRREGFVNVRTV